MGSLLLVSNRGLLRTDAMSRALLAAGGGLASLGVFLWAAPAKDQRNLVVPRTALVIGGGVIGLSSAYQLALRGVHVTVLEERQDTGQVASFCNGAILCQSMAASWASARLIAENPGEVKRMRVSLAAWLDPQFWRWAAWFWLNSLMPGWADFNHQSHRLLALYSLKCQEEEEERLGEQISCGKTALETLRLFTCPKEMAAFLESDQAQFWSNAGYPFFSLTAEECRELEPSLAPASQPGPTIVGGVRCSVDSSGEVYKYVQNLGRVAREVGVEVRCGASAEHLRMEDGRVAGLVLDSGEQVEADIYIVAAGAMSSKIAAQAGVNVPVYPLKGHMATAKLPGLRRNIYSPRQGLASPLSGGRVRIAGMVEAVGWDHTVEQDKGRRVMEALREVFADGVMKEEDATFHSCLRPVSADDVAIIGRTSVGNLWVNTGHGSKGWTYCWGSSTLLAQLITGQEPGITDAEERFSPLRFHPVRRRLGYNVSS